MLDQNSLVRAQQCVLTIDPGLSGATFKIGRGVFVGWRDFKTRQEIAQAVNDLCLTPPFPDYAVIEEVHAMPGQGVCSMFSFGESFGVALGALYVRIVDQNFPLIGVSPQRWQNFFRKELGILKGQEFDSCAIALKLFPDYAQFFKRKKDHNSADAVLMAVWEFEQLSASQTTSPDADGRSKRKHLE